MRLTEECYNPWKEIPARVRDTFIPLYKAGCPSGRYTKLKLTLLCAVNQGRRLSRSRVVFTHLKHPWICEKQIPSFWMHKISALTEFHRAHTHENCREGMILSLYLLLVNGLKSSLRRTAPLTSLQCWRCCFVFHSAAVRKMRHFSPFKLMGKDVG